MMLAHMELQEKEEKSKWFKSWKKKSGVEMEVWGWKELSMEGSSDPTKAKSSAKFQ